MIYISKGVQTNAMQGISSDPFEYIWNYEPQIVEIDEYNAREIYKKNYAMYYLAGELLNSKRGNENLLNKELLSLDYEALDISLNEFLSVIHEKLDGLSYMLYPTIHCFNKGNDNRFRYRLVINLDREYTEEENRRLVQNVGMLIGLDYDPKSETFSQLMGLPILTPFTNANMIHRVRGEPLSVDDVLSVESKDISTPNIDDSFKFNFDKKYTAIFLEELIEGVSEGNRNNWLTQQVGRLLYLGMEHSIAYQWLWLINDNFVNPPLKDKELNTIFRSILNKELKKAR